MGAAENGQSVAGAGHADRAPGAGEKTGEGGGCGVMSGRGCVGGDGHCRFPHQESAGRSRRFGLAEWIHSAYSSDLAGGRKKN